MYDEGEADDARHLELDLGEEVRCNVLLQSSLYLQGVCRYHNHWRYGPSPHPGRDRAAQA
jgi:hypothetical protein